MKFNDITRPYMSYDDEYVINFWKFEARPNFNYIEYNQALEYINSLHFDIFIKYPLNFFFLESELIFITIFLFFFLYILFFLKNKNNIILQFNYILLNCFFILIYFFTFYQIDNLTNVYKIFFNIYFTLFLILINFNTLKKNYNYEEFLLLLLILFSTKTLLDSNNIITIILLIEIQTFCLLILNLSNKQNILKSETSLKYFIISAITSGLFLFGFSNLYYFTGSLNLNEIFLFFLFSNNNLFYLNNSFYLISISCIFLSLIIKLGLFPFHNWLLDLYNGFNFNLIFIMFILQKPILFFLLFKIYAIFNFFILNSIINQIIILISILSIIIGSIGILLQSNLKKFLGYSSLVINSYLLLLLLNNLFFFNIFFLVFIFIYNLNNFLFFYSFQNINLMSNKKIKNLIEIYNLFYINKYLTIIFIITLFSFLGLPPFSGFFSKYLILFILNLNNFLFLSIIILILNILSSFYYLRIIKLLYINEKYFYIFNSLEYINNKNKNILQFSNKFQSDLFIFLFILNLFLFFKLDFFFFLQNYLF